VRRCQIEVVKCLLSHHCYVDHQDRHGNTPLHIACKDGNLPVVMHLCAAKANMDIPNKVSFKLGGRKNVSPEPTNALIPERDIIVEAVGEHGSFGKAQELPDIIPKQENVHKEQSLQKDILKEANVNQKEKKKRSLSRSRSRSLSDTKGKKSKHSRSRTPKKSTGKSGNHSDRSSSRDRSVSASGGKGRTKRRSSRSPAFSLPQSSWRAYGLG